jgi:hypothetical protein
MITSFVIPILAVVALALVHGFVRPRAGCGANCSVCKEACNSEKVEGSHV